MKSILNTEKSVHNQTDNFHIIRIINNFLNDSNNFFLKYPGQPESIRQLSQKLLPTTIPTVRNSTLFRHKSKRGTKERKTTVEIAVFFDSAAYRIFAPHFNYDNNKIRDMLLAYINGVISSNFKEYFIAHIGVFFIGSIIVSPSIIGYTDRFNHRLYGNHEDTANRSAALLWREEFAARFVL